MIRIAIVTTALLASTMSYSSAPECSGSKYSDGGSFQSQLDLSNQAAFLSGDLGLDIDRGTIQLDLQAPMPPCPAGMLCAQVMPAPEVFRFADVSMTHDECEVTIFESSYVIAGEEDSYHIQVADYTTSICVYFLAVPDTEITFSKSIFDEDSQSFVDSEFKFQGNELRK